MDQPLYDIYFTGQLVDGTDTATARANLATLFKTTPDNVAKLFNGKPQPLKRGVDKAGALKYKAALHKAGLLVAFKTHQQSRPDNEATIPAEPQPDQNTGSNPGPVTTPITAAASSEQEQTDWSLAPAGSDVLRENERQQITPVEVDTSQIKMVSAFMDLEPDPIELPPAPDTSHITVAASGEDLLVDKPQAPPAPPLDLDAITLAPAGTELEQLHDELPPVNPDTSALSIAAAGVDILEGQTKTEPPPAPNTDHISVDK